MPPKSCTACGESMEAHWKTCPLCGLVQADASTSAGSAKRKGASTIELDDTPPAPARAAPPLRAATPAEEAMPTAPRDDSPPSPGKAAAPESEDDEGIAEGTLRMSMGEATKAWLEDSAPEGGEAAPRATAVPKRNLKALIVVLVVAIVALGVVLAVL